MTRRMDAAVEPPVLTVREDGSPVELGGFDDAPAGAEAESRPATVDAIIEAMGTALDRQRGQLEALGTASPGPALRRIADDLAQTVRQLEELKRALARWSQGAAT